MSQKHMGTRGHITRYLRVLNLDLAVYFSEDRDPLTATVPTKQDFSDNSLAIYVTLRLNEETLLMQLDFDYYRDLEDIGGEKASLTPASVSLLHGTVKSYTERSRPLKRGGTLLVKVAEGTIEQQLRFVAQIAAQEDLNIATGPVHRGEWRFNSHEEKLSNADQEDIRFGSASLDL